MPFERQKRRYFRTAYELYGFIEAHVGSNRSQMKRSISDGGRKKTMTSLERRLQFSSTELLSGRSTSTDAILWWKYENRTKFMCWFFCLLGLVRGK